MEMKLDMEEMELDGRGGDCSGLIWARERYLSLFWIISGLPLLQRDTVARSGGHWEYRLCGAISGLEKDLRPS